MPKTYAVPPPPHHNEGKTVAAWTMNLGIFLGALVIAAGMILHDVLTTDVTFLVWIGIAVVVLSLVAGIALAKAGKGQPRHYGIASAAATAHGGENARANEPSGSDAR